MQSNNAVGKSTAIPNVFAAANASTAIVIEAPAMFTAEPNGIEMEYISGSSPNLSQSFKLTGIFAAELLVKNAYIPLCAIVAHTSGYGFFLKYMYTIAGFITKATIAYAPIKTASRCAYPTNALKPLLPIASATNPIIPNGAKRIIQPTTFVTVSATSAKNTFVDSFPQVRSANPKTIAQTRIPIKLA